VIDLDLRWDLNKRRNEAEALRMLAETTDLMRGACRDRPPCRLAGGALRSGARPGLMDVFLAQYGLSTDEGVALMCLAEALLRVPDVETIDALIEDKIAPSDWSRHVGRSSSPLVNASTWALMLTGKVLDADRPGVAGTLRGMVRRLGEPVIRAAVGRAMRELGNQFVLGQDIGAAMTRAKEKEAEGFTYSYDMLGEAAMTSRDASRYARAYSEAIAAIAEACGALEIAANPGISIKLSALHPRYEVAKTRRVLDELVPTVRGLARQAAQAGVGLIVPKRPIALDCREVSRRCSPIRV
jgi:RHH-type proline utilization regulon transcriptional repressor/proline dehydrogenase/delta 1-pyrroline-5-carboxylate dehydrogenase